jgi:ectoine hydroxylase-related dioxygenase (phytanoyl-CoA dioxygenase family)
MSYPEYKAGVCWIPLTNYSEKNGSLIFIPSKNPKFIKKTKSFKNDNFTSEQYTSPLSSIEIKKIKQLKINVGDAAFFNMNIKHKSGINNSKKIRITIGCRFHDMSKSFNVGKEIYFFNENLKSKLF